MGFLGDGSKIVASARVAKSVDATALGRRRMIASHRRLIQRRSHLSPVPEGYRIVAGELVAQVQLPVCTYPRGYVP